MPLTLDVKITLTDAQLAEIRGPLVTPVITPPVVIVPPVVVPEPTKLHFGYYGSLHGQDEETKDHTSFTFAPGWDGSGLPLTRPTVVFSPDGGSLLPTLQKIKEQGGLHHIIALYPQDEPAENGLNENQTVACFEAARQAARDVGMNPVPPIMVCYGKKGQPGIYNADIIGLDWYEHGPQKIGLARVGQKRFYVPGSANPWQEDPVAFVNAAQADSQAWGVVCFIWLDQWGGTQNLGVKSNGTVGRHREAYARLGWTTPTPVVVDTHPAIIKLGWHGDFRFQPTSPAARNFNFLMEQGYGANVAWNYMMTVWEELGQVFEQQAGSLWNTGETARVINHYSNAGVYAPPEFNDPGRRICNVKGSIYSYDMGRKRIGLPF